jgi:hypothetical protein
VYKQYGGDMKKGENIILQNKNGKYIFLSNIFQSSQPYLAK